MANRRYGMYQYETSPRKIEPEYIPQKKTYANKKSNTLKQNNANRREEQKRRIKSHIKVVIYIAVVFSALFLVSYRNSLINESFNKNADLKQELAVIQKENEQLQVNIENSLNLNNIEKLAKERLGMQKLDNSQKVYVSLPKKDYVEPAVEEVEMEKELNWFQKLMKFLGM